ncbi:hypothetical protein KIN20_034721 [Parelaphostrongylus tenuis]|uniref:Uncharacterized protein n=1 Tax=Parelaphostrongylus tenuis TaxID=148309 RepID=A0AAD5RAV1_PARTN|nr:hypothetical protein KIN20_034721 [Parelaphostrongylus tenuis]
MIQVDCLQYFGLVVIKNDKGCETTTRTDEFPQHIALGLLSYLIFKHTLSYSCRAVHIQEVASLATDQIL